MSVADYWNISSEPAEHIPSEIDTQFFDNINAKTKSLLHFFHIQRKFAAIRNCLVGIKCYLSVLKVLTNLQTAAAKRKKCLKLITMLLNHQDFRPMNSKLEQLADNIANGNYTNAVKLYYELDTFYASLYSQKLVSL